MWCELLCFVGGSTAGFLGGAMMANARHGDERLAADLLVDAVRSFVHESSEQTASSSRADSLEPLRLALQQYDAFYQESDQAESSASASRRQFKRSL